VGIVEKSKLIDGSRVKAGDILLGLASSGPHSNGYSLIRKIIERAAVPLSDLLEEKPLAQHLIAPTRIYVKSLLALFDQIPVHALAHITGGGITENLPRVLPDDLQAEIDLSAWEWPAIFDWLQSHGQVTDTEMLKTFNCGIGMVICVAPEDQNTAIRYLEISVKQ
jgi:phosphoribosylformylglycinamidine cyclo-ligase (EC 6.3.3.1)